MLRSGLHALPVSADVDCWCHSEAMRLGATTLANSTIVSVDDSGAMAASGIALVVTEPTEP